LQLCCWYQGDFRLVREANRRTVHGLCEAVCIGLSLMH
jgi:hypothetical protein